MHFKFVIPFLAMLMLVILDGNEVKADCLSKYYTYWCGPWAVGTCNWMCESQENRPGGGYCSSDNKCKCRGCQGEIKVTYYYNVYHLPPKRD